MKKELKRFFLILLLTTTILFLYRTYHTERKKKIYADRIDQTVILDVVHTVAVDECDEFSVSTIPGTCELLRHIVHPKKINVAGSGSVWKIDEKIYILTVAHICLPTQFPETFNAMGISGSLKVKSIFKFESSTASGSGRVRRYDRKNDLCMLEIDPKTMSGYFPSYSSLAQKKDIPGTHVIYSGAPSAIMTKSAVLSFSGVYAGDANGYSFFSLPCAQGASGSAIRNESGKIFSIVTNVDQSFNHICYGVTYENLKKFLR